MSDLESYIETEMTLLQEEIDRLSKSEEAAKRNEQWIIADESAITTLQRVRNHILYIERQAER